MKNTTTSKTATSNTRASMESSSSVENLSLSFGTLHVKMDRVENNDGASLSNNSLVLPSNGGASVRNNSLVLPSNGSLTRTQQDKVLVEPMNETRVKNSIPVPTSLYSQGIWAPHTSSNRGETMRVNSGYAAPSTSNNTASGSIVGSGYMKGGVVNQNQDQDYSVGCQSEAIANVLSNQQSLNNAGFLDEEKGLESSKGYDILMLALDPSGPQHLQGMLSLKNPEITRKIFEGVIAFIFVLMTNQFGHHVFGKLIESCDDNQLQLIVAKITSQSKLFVDASRDRYGSHCIKKLIKVLEKSPLVSEVILALHNEFFGVMTNRTGSYVVLKCLDILDTQKNDLIYQAAIKHCLQLATDENGCLSLKNFIINTKGPRREQLLDLISEHSVYLSQDPSGNYVLQHVIELHNPVFTEKICSLLKGHYIRLSLQRGGSHVVEKCLNSPGIAYVLEDFLKSNNLSQVARDPYGNYVIQAALNITRQTRSPFHQNLLMKLQPLLNYPQLGYGRNVVNMIRNEIPVKKP